jgi:transcriptional regulator with AAA-type ATPase domain
LKLGGWAVAGESKAIKSARVAQVFTPGAPIDQLSFLAGRVAILLDIVNAIAPKGQHVVVYGEWGVGKTSLTNV